MRVTIPKISSVSRFTLRDAVKKNTSYSVTLSLKVGGGQDQIILLEAAKIVTS